MYQSCNHAKTDNNIIIDNYYSNLLKFTQIYPIITQVYPDLPKFTQIYPKYLIWIQWGPFLDIFPAKTWCLVWMWGELKSLRILRGRAGVSGQAGCTWIYSNLPNLPKLLGNFFELSGPTLISSNLSLRRSRYTKPVPGKIYASGAIVLEQFQSHWGTPAGSSGPTKKKTMNFTQVYPNRLGCKNWVNFQIRGGGKNFSPKFQS